LTNRDGNWLPGNEYGKENWPMSEDTEVEEPERPETEEEKAAREAEAAQWEREARERAEKSRLECKAVMRDLKAAGVVLALVEYDGNGDSGDIESVVFLDAANQDVKVSDDLERRTSDTAMDFLCGEHGGWENGEGAYGTISFHVDTGKARIEHNERYESSELYESEIGFGEEELATVEEASGGAKLAPAPEQSVDEIRNLLYDNRWGRIPLSVERAAELKERFRLLTGRRFEG
jgi:hypothetical protein